MSVHNFFSSIKKEWKVRTTPIVYDNIGTLVGIKSGNNNMDSITYQRICNVVKR